MAPTLSKATEADVINDGLQNLADDYLKQVKNHCSNINAIGGKGYKQLAEELAEIKDILIRHGGPMKGVSGGDDDNPQWLEFCDSGKVNMGSRTIRDLVAAGKWINETTLSDETLGNHSVRVLARLAKIKIEQNKLFKQIERQMESERVTEKALSGLLGKAKGSSDKPSALTKTEMAKKYEELNYEVDQLKNANQALVQNLGRTTQERDTLQSRVDQLELRMDKLLLITSTPESRSAVVDAYTQLGAR